MIEWGDPYWRRLIGLALGATVVLAAVAFVALPVSEEGHGGGVNSAPPGSLKLTEVLWEPAFDDQHLRVWVNVTNPGSKAAENLTGTLLGTQPTVNLGGETETHNGNLARGGSATQTFKVVAQTSATVNAQITNFAPRASLTLEVTSPAGKAYSGQPAGSGAAVSLSTADVEAGLFGDWQAKITEVGGFRGVSYSLTIDSQYQAASPNITLGALPPGETYSFLWFVDSAEPAPSLPPGVKIDVTGTVFDAKGAASAVAFESTPGAPPVERPAGGAAGGDAFLTSGEFLGFSAIGVLGLSVASGIVRKRGGRADSQNRARSTVTWHRLAWVSVLVILLLHGLAQLAGGHLYLAAASVGTAAFGLLAGLVWFNAYNRPRVLAMEWPRWLRLKLLWVTAALSFVALHLLLFGRHFAG